MATTPSYSTETAAAVTYSTQGDFGLGYFGHGFFGAGTESGVMSVSFSEESATSVAFTGE